jgi:hypothetical protein
MTPKEKAKKLVDKYNHNKLLYMHLNLEKAKQCALIAVDEIIYTLYDVNSPYIYKQIDFWHQVRHEISLL